MVHDANEDANVDEPEDPDAALAVVLAYHERSKHMPFRYAPSLGYLDWDTQPDPFRRFEGAPTFELALSPVLAEPSYEAAFVPGQVAPAPCDVETVARLFRDALALSAWKEIPGTRWSLRVNPSSGNLHPTEAYLVAGPIAGLHDAAGVYHYAPYLHALELRSELAAATWSAIARQLPTGAMLVGLTSIHWRESWKYGERAFRYCQHDVGHAIGCVSIAAAGLGWEARLLEEVVDEDLAVLLRVQTQTGIEAEHADCLLVVYPRGQEPSRLGLEPAIVETIREAVPRGEPNVLSADHHAWPAIDEVAAATRKLHPPTRQLWATESVTTIEPLQVGDAPISLRAMIHQRRSAVALDGQTGITRAAFLQILRKTLPAPGQIPFATLPWSPCVDLLLFVHRVQGVTPGLYALVRDPSRKAALMESMEASFEWKPEAASLGLYLLEEGDARRVAQQTSCGQAIAADGVFAAAMLCEYREPLHRYGPWFYRRLFWETGVVGQVLYLEAEASGIRATGIGCFFDDVTHRAFGLEGDRFQVLYHFTMGGPVDDERLRTAPPYDHLERGE